MQRKKKRRSTCVDSSKQHSSEHWSPQYKAPMDKFGTVMRSRYALFRKQYKNRLMQNQAMEITAGRAMRHRAILGDFASPDSQIAMETSIIGCRIARFCFSVTGLLANRISFRFDGFGQWPSSRSKIESKNAAEPSESFGRPGPEPNRIFDSV